MSLERSLLAAQGYLELEMPTDALGELDRLPPHERESESVLQMRLFILLKERIWEPALAVCAAMRERYPESTTGFIHGAFCLHELGRTREAKAMLISGPGSLAQEPTYFYNLGCYDAVLGNVEDAIKNLRISFQMDEKFLAIAKYDPDLKAVSGMF